MHVFAPPQFVSGPPAPHHQLPDRATRQIADRSHIRASPRPSPTGRAWRPVGKCTDRVYGTVVGLGGYQDARCWARVLLRWRNSSTTISRNRDVEVIAKALFAACVCAGANMCAHVLAPSAVDQGALDHSVPKVLDPSTRLIEIDTTSRIPISKCRTSQLPPATCTSTSPYARSLIIVKSHRPPPTPPRSSPFSPSPPAPTPISCAAKVPADTRRLQT